MAKTFIDSQGFERYESSKRLVYNSELFENHGTPWSKEDLIDMVGYRQTMKWEDIALMLGRTPGTCASKMRDLKKQGRYDFYLKKFKEASL